MDVELVLEADVADLTMAVAAALKAHDDRLTALEGLTALQAEAIHKITGLLTARAL